MEQKKKILVVDDSKELSGIMSDMLEFKGYETLVANNGKDAIVTALKEHPDLILLDLRMPDLDGYQVVRKLRKDVWGKTVKILILTAAGEVSDIPPDLGIEPSDYLLKALWGIENVGTKVKQKLAEGT